MIEAEVFGDPDAMRALATVIAGRADVIAGVPTGFGSALAGAAFEGPAAERLRGAGDAARGGISAVVAELHGIASALLGDADVVERMNEDAKAKAEAAEAAEKAAAGDDGGRDSGDAGAGQAERAAAATAPPGGAEATP